jgi:isocitrate dehydrogenase kinase/phosphatase
MNEHLTDSRLANLGASAIHCAFAAYQTEFSAITGRARRRFEAQDWQGMLRDSAARLELYKAVVDRLVAEIREMLSDRVANTFVWVSIKAVYSGLIGGRDDWEIAETFFNSVTRRIFATVGVDPQLEFIATDFDTPPTPPSQPVYRTYRRPESTAGLIAAILDDFPFDAPFEDRGRDIALVAAALDARMADAGGWAGRDQVEMVGAVFYRNKGAYLVGRIAGAEPAIPLVLALLNGPSGIRVDAALLHEQEVSILFSFTRSYFHVDCDRPYDLVHFLQAIMPRKRITALYTSIGNHKHGKTEWYRDLLRHLRSSDDKFEIARGERGMVMAVWTLPSYDVVFKVIKDHFDPPKTSTRQGVMDKYHLVFKHDRAGRLVDAQEYEHLKFERSRFEPALLAELERVAPSTVVVADEYVIIKHVYVERRVTPLNLYIREAAPAAVEAAVVDFGNAIKDLTASNIFPGDILLKNFGVTRHGRVVFYDYDELCLLTVCQFKALPEPSSYDEEMAAEPWFAVGEYDVFPEEFRYFMSFPQPYRDVFLRHHADIFELEFWRRMQARMQAGEVVDILAYAESRRLGGHPGAEPDSAAG